MPHTRSGHDQDRSRNMRTRNRRLGPLVQHPPPPLPGRHHTTTSRKATHNNTKGSGLNKPPQNPGLDTPAKGHCTRYVALHPLRGAAPVTSRCTRTEGVQCLQIGCNAYTSGARPPVTSSDADLPEWRSTDPTGLAAPGGGAPPTTNSARRQRAPNNQRDPAAAHPQQPTGPGDGRAWRGFETTHRAGGPRRMAPAASRPGRGAHIQRTRARRSRGIRPGARGTHATNPGPGRAYDEAGTRRAKQRRGPRPRQ